MMAIILMMSTRNAHFVKTKLLIALNAQLQKIILSYAPLANRDIIPSTRDWNAIAARTQLLDALIVLLIRRMALRLMRLTALLAINVLEVIGPLTMHFNASLVIVRSSIVRLALGPKNMLI